MANTEIIVIRLADCRTQQGRPEGWDFQIMQVKNSTEWVCGEYLDEGKVKMLCSRPDVEVSIKAIS